MTGFALRPDLDAPSLAARMADRGRVHVGGLLAPGGAERLHAALAAPELDWARTIDNPAHLDIPLSTFERQGEAQKQGLIDHVYDRAAEGFQFLFDRIRIHWAVDRGLPVDPVLADFYRFLNTPEFLAFANRLTGHDDIVYCDAHAARYLPGHFLNAHTDVSPEPGRVAAFVVNMTPRWRSDWGGHLNFLDARGDIEEGFVPAFDAMNVFMVPCVHAVSFVAPFAAAPRLTVTGWFRSQPPAYASRAA